MSTFKRLLAGVSSLALMMTMGLVNTFAYNDISGHWAEDYINDLADRGIVDGSKPSFNPETKLTRAELTKMAVEACLGGIDHDVQPSSATFSDTAGHWGEQYIETAYAYDMISGFAPGTFRPDAPITRAETLKILLEGCVIPTQLNPPSTYTDVNQGDWFYDYVTTAANHCIVDGNKPAFNGNSNITRAEVAKVTLNTMAVADGADVCAGGEPTDPTDPVDPDGDDDLDGVRNADDDCPGTSVGMEVDENGCSESQREVSPSDGTLEVSRAATNPTGKTIPLDGNNVPFLALDLTAGPGEDLECVNFVISRSGLGEQDDIEDVKVFDGPMQRGGDRGFTSDQEIASLNLNAEPFFIPAGSTKTALIAADIDGGATLGGEHAFAVDLPDDIICVGADTGGPVQTTGDFPLIGNIMTIGSVSVGSLDFEFRTVADNEVEVGKTNAEVARVNVEAGPEEDVLLQAATFEFDGVDDNEVGNCFVSHQGEAVSNVIDFITNEEGLFDFTGLPDGGWLLEDGDNRTMRIYCDIFGGVDEDLTVQFDDPSTDVLATGLRYGFGVSVAETPGSTPDTIAILGGDLTVTINSSVRDVAVDSDNVSGGTLTFRNLGEAIEVKDDMRMFLSVGGGLTLSDAAAGITDVRLVNVETGSTVMGPEDVDFVGGDAEVIFSDEFILETNEVLILDILFDIEPGPLVEGNEFFWNLQMETVCVEGIVSGDDSCGGNDPGFPFGPHDITPPGDPTTRTYTIENPTLTVSKKTRSNDSYVARADDVEVFRGVFRANSVEHLIVRSIEFMTVAGSTVEPGDIDNFSIYMLEGTARTLLETGEDLNGPNGVPCGASCSLTFSGMNSSGASGLRIPAGGEIGIMVTADIASTLSAGAPFFALEVSAAGDVDAEDEEGDAAQIEGTFPVQGATYTLVESGTLDVELKENETPDSTLLASGDGDTWFPVGAFEFEAENEDIQVSDMSVDIVGVAADLDGDTVDDTFDCDTGTPGIQTDCYSDAIEALALFYDDGTQVMNSGGGMAETIDVADGMGFFEDIDLIIPSSEDQFLVFVRARLNEIANNEPGRSGMTFRVNLSFDDAAGESEVRGLESGLEITVGGGDITVDGAGFDTLAGDLMYTARNQLIAELSSGQTTTLSAGNREGMKFNLITNGDRETYLKEVRVNLAQSGAGYAVCELRLKDGSTLISSVDTGAALTGDQTLMVDSCDVGTCNPSDAANDRHVIDQGSDTFTIEVTIENGACAGSPTFGDNDKLTLELGINGTDPGSDDILWQDYGTDGTDGAMIRWIDLGADDDSTTRLSNTLD